MNELAKPKTAGARLIAHERQGNRFAQLRALPLPEVAARLGIRSLSKSMRCPLPGHEDRHPSFAYFSETNSWKCFGCGRGGSTIDLVAAMFDCSIAEAADWLGGERDRVSMAPLSARVTKDRGVRSYERAKPDPRVYGALLSMCPLSQEARDYLHSRGFSDQTLAHFQLGSLVAAPPVMADLIRQFGRSRLYAAGLLSSQRAVRLTLPSNSIVFPFLNGKDVTYLQSRRMPGAEGPRWMGLSGVKKPIFNIGVIAGASTVYVCEGATDVMSAHELGLCAIGLLGSTSRTPAEVLSLLAQRTVYVIPDNDRAGQSMLKAFVADLEKAGGKAVERKIPVGADLNDYLVMKRKAGATAKG